MIKQARGKTHLLAKVEGHGLVRDLHVGDLDDDSLKLCVVPVDYALHHGQTRVVGLVCGRSD